METLIPIMEEVPNDFKKVVGDQLQELMTRSQEEYWDWKVQGKENYRILNRHPMVKKIQESWPNAPNLRAVGFKVNPKRYSSDDEIYQNNSELLAALPRGVVYVNTALTIFAFTKFFGLRQGDDDQNSHLSTEVDKSAIHFFVSAKANGEMAQIYWYNESNNPFEQGWIIGSKNRKIFLTVIEDLVYYDDKPEYKFAIIIAQEFFKILNQLPNEKVNNLKKFLEQTKMTMIWELENINSQHLEPFDKNDLVLVGLSSIAYPQGFHPVFTYALAQYLDGLNCVIRGTHQFNTLELDYACQRVSTDSWGREGVVLYFLNKEHQVIQMVKLKSWWYILLRAIREKLRSHLRTGSAILCQQQLRRRLSEIQKSMSVPKFWVEKFTILGCAFAIWFFKQFHQLSDNTNLIEEFNERYPMLWRRFLKENELPDDESLLKADLSRLEVMVEFEQPKPALLVMFQGIPGLGKNFLAEKLKDALSKIHCLVCEVVAQDDFFHLGMKKSGQACFDHVTNLIYSGSCNVVFLARNNSNRQQYKRYLKFPRLLFLAPDEIRSKFHELLALAVTSVLNRKKSSEEKHPTDSLSNTTLASLPFKFAAGFSYYPNAFRIKFLNDQAKLNVEDRMTIGQEINLYRKAKNPFTVDDLSSDILNSLDLETPLSFRRPIDGLIDDCLQAIRLGLKHQIPLENQYLAVVLDEESKKKMAPILEFYPGKVLPEEILLMHSREFQNDPDHWTSLSQIIGKQYRVVISRYKQKLDQLVVAEVLFSDGLNSEVYGGGPPYLVMDLTSKGKENEALEILQNDNISWVMMGSPIEMDGKVCLLP